MDTYSKIKELEARIEALESRLTHDLVPDEHTQPVATDEGAAVKRRGKKP